MKPKMIQITRDSYQLLTSNSALLEKVLRGEQNRQEYKSGDREKGNKEGYWHYIPNHDIRSVWRLLNQMNPTVKSSEKPPYKNYNDRRRTNKKFLELGAGIGYFTALADNMRYDATGIELSKEAVEKGRELFFVHSNLTHGLLCGDIMNEQKRIEEADIIYFYSPFQRNKAYDFITFVVTNAKIGATLFMKTHCSEEETRIKELLKKEILIRKDGYERSVFIKKKPLRVTAVKHIPTNKSPRK